MADNVIASFLTEIGFRTEPNSERKLKETIRTAALQAQVLADALEAMAKTAARAISDVIKGFDDLYFASQRTNASVTNIRALSYAFSQVGSSGQQALSALEGFQRAMRTNPGVSAFIRSLGVATNDAQGKARDSTAIISDAIDTLQKRHPYYVASQMAEIFGVSEDQYYTFTKYRKELKEFEAERKRIVTAVGLNEQEAAETSTKFSRALRSVYMVIGIVGEKIATAVLPTLTKWIELLREWLEENSDKFIPIIMRIVDEVEKFAREGGFIDMMKTLVKDAKELAAHFKDILEFLRQVNDFTKGDAVGATVSWLLGRRPGEGGDVHPPAANDNAGEEEKPGAFRRGYNAVKRALGFGGGGEASDGIHRRGRRAAKRDETNYNFTGENADALRQAAKELGTSPEDLATVISYESKFRPGVWGGKGGNYMGLIQFGGPERAQFGANDKQSFKEQLPAVVRYLKTRGFKPGMGLLDLYSTINAGAPGHYNASDGNGTVRSHVERMRVQEAARVRRFLNSGSVGSVPNPTTGLPTLPNIGGGAKTFDVNKLPVGTMGSTTTTSDNSRSVNQNNPVNVTITGAQDAGATGTSVERAVNSANELSLRNAQAAIR